MIQLPHSRNEVLNASTENAISALTKMCRYQPDSLPAESHDQFLQNWLTWLPVWEDEEEVIHVLDFLCELVENSNMAILGQDNCNLPVIVRAIVVPLQKETLLPDLSPEMKRLVVEMVPKF